MYQTMPHATSSCEKMDEFVGLHKTQLVASGVPERYWETLFVKLKNEVFDAGDVFTIIKVEEVYSDEEEDDGGGTHEADEDEPAYSWQVVVNSKEGLTVDDPSHIYLVDHAWTYRVNTAADQLNNLPGLLPRMTALMDIEIGGKDTDQLVEEVLNEMWRYNSTYNIGNAPTASEEAGPIWYIMDEFGSRIQHAEDPSFRAVPIVHVPTQMTYTVVFPVRDLSDGDEVTRNYVESIEAEGLLRRIKLLPWQPDDMTHLSYEQMEEDESFFLKYHVHETLPNLDQDILPLPRDRNITVYTDVPHIVQYLKDSRFELVDNFDDADIIWTQNYLKDFKAFSEDSPGKLINQFPFEMVITVKDLFSMVSRRAASRRQINHETLETFPPWLETTFNLKTELPQFVSFFQHREQRGLSNYWICKPWNLARSLDIHITDQLNYILRLTDTGPKIACHYIEDPVLFNIDDIGPVKFDMRFVVLLHAVDPLKISIYRKFLLRFSNKVFSMDHFEDYEKHFTVMKYKDNITQTLIDCNTFVDQFEEQYPNKPWQKIEESIYEVVKALFTAATARPAPKGIGVSPQSRAMYGVDIILKWKTNDKGEKCIQPSALEVNFGPDCERLCNLYPDFMSDIFGALFLDDGDLANICLL